MIDTYIKNDTILQYKLIFKPIKHVYFRRKDHYILITANKHMSKKQVLSILDNHFEKLVQTKRNSIRIQTSKYQLWGEFMDENSFFGSYDHSQSNYEKILIRETVNQINRLSSRLEHDLQKLNLTLKPTKVKILKSKFGSCQIIKKEITINAFLAKLEPKYLYYVLLHEYCHLLEPNHSKAFYEKLDQLMNDHKTIQKALRKYVITF